MRQDKEIKVIHIGKKELKQSLIADNIILYIENPKESTKKKNLKLINNFYKVAGYKNNIKNKSYYANDETSEKEIKKLFYLQLHPKQNTQKLI